MSDYVAPLKDMQFVLNELAGLDQLAKLPGCEDVSVELVEQILEESGKFCAEVLSPLNQPGDAEGSKWDQGKVTTPKGFNAAYKQFVEGGWNALQFPAEFGGQGLPKLVATPVMEMWKSANLSFSLCPLLTGGAIEALLLSGTDRLKQTYLPKMVAGKWTGTMNLTEPQAGTDLALVKPKAVPRRRPLSRLRPEDIHHLRRARHGRQHRPPGAGAHARRARGCEGHFAVRRAQVPGQRRRHPRHAQRREVRFDRTQARHPRAVPPRSWSTAKKAARSAIWWARRTRASNTCSS